MTRITLIFLFIVVSIQGLNKLQTQSGEYPYVLSSASTILGELEIVRTSVDRREVRLNRRVILKENDEKYINLTGDQMYAMNPITPTSIVEVVHQRLPPFDEVVILNNGYGARYCGPGVVFLGLKKNGTYKYSSPTSWCSDEPKITVGKNYIEVTSGAYVHSTDCSFGSVLGGRWIYKHGKLFIREFILLPDPEKNRKPCGSRH
jgi:hypothetical protein